MSLYGRLRRHRWVRVTVGLLAILCQLYCAIFTLVVSILLLTGTAHLLVCTCKVPCPPR